MSPKINANAAIAKFNTLLATIDKLTGLGQTSKENEIAVDEKISCSTDELGRLSQNLPVCVYEVINRNPDLVSNEHVKLGLEVYYCLKNIIRHVTPFITRDLNLLDSVHTLGAAVAIVANFIQIITLASTFVVVNCKAVKDHVKNFKDIIDSLGSRIKKINTELKIIENRFASFDGDELYPVSAYNVPVKFFQSRVEGIKNEIEECTVIIKDAIPKIQAIIAKLTVSGTTSAVLAGIMAVATVPLAISAVVATGGLALIPVAGAAATVSAAGGFGYHAHTAFTGRKEIERMRKLLEERLVEVEQCRIDLEQNIKIYREGNM